MTVGGAASSLAAGCALPAGLPAAVAVFQRVSGTYETVGPAFFDHFGSLLVQHADVQPGDRVLDLACGAGAVSVPALAAGGADGSLLAIDLAPGMVARLREGLAGIGHRAVRVLQADAADPPAEQASADVVLCGFGLFFMPDPPAVLQRWVRLLAPGGRLAVSTWGRPDDAFLFVRDQCRALGARLPGGGQAYDDAAVLAQALALAGLQGVHVLSVVHDLVLSDAEQLLRWCASHGARAWLEQLDQAADERLLAAVRERWPGPVPMSWQAHLAVAHRPGPGAP